MLIDLQKLLNYLLLALAVCGGIVTGMLGGRIVDLSLGRGTMLLPPPVAEEPRARQLEQDDFQVVLDRNLFDSSAVGQASQQVDLSLAKTPGREQQVTRPVGDLDLIGTVVAGADSLALIQVGRKTGIYRLKEELAPGVEVAEIFRNRVIVLEQGARRELLLKPDNKQKSQARVVRQTPASGSDGIVSLGNNRWQISRAAAENARNNFNSLLSSARMIPQMQNGETVGFRLVDMERGSLLEKIGLKLGDLVVEINDVTLNSPEKALQVFQQVREASNISLGLVRNGKRETFEYSFE